MNNTEDKLFLLQAAESLEAMGAKWQIEGNENKGYKIFVHAQITGISLADLIVFNEKINEKGFKVTCIFCESVIDQPYTSILTVSIYKFKF